MHLLESIQRSNERSIDCSPSIAGELSNEQTIDRLIDRSLERASERLRARVSDPRTERSIELRNHWQAMMWTSDLLLTRWPVHWYFFKTYYSFHKGFQFWTPCFGENCCRESDMRNLTSQKRSCVQALSFLYRIVPVKTLIPISATLFFN